MIAYAVLKETISGQGPIRYFKEGDHAVKYCAEHNSEFRLFPRYYVEAILIEEEYKEEGKDGNLKEKV